MNTATKVGNKKIIDITKTQGSEFGKTAGKNIVQKSAEASGDLIRNKIADKITSLGKSKNKENKTSEEEIIIPQKKDNKSLMTFNII